jgi:hypothetical protein
MLTEKNGKIKCSSCDYKNWQKFKK